MSEVLTEAVRGRRERRRGWRVSAKPRRSQGWGSSVTALRFNNFNSCARINKCRSASSLLTFVPTALRPGEPSARLLLGVHWANPGEHWVNPGEQSRPL